MKKVLMVYKSKTGFTKKYVDWIIEEFPCKTCTLEKMKQIGFEDYDVIIYGAGMHAGHIRGLKKFKKYINFQKTQVIVFATGAAPNTNEIVAKIKENNFIENPAGIEFFYFESGINYEKMAIIDKIIMRVYSKILKWKTKKSEIEEGTSTALLKSYDNSNIDNIKPLMTFLKDYINVG